jgi:hypothetical protein
MLGSTPQPVFLLKELERTQAIADVPAVGVSRFWANREHF